MRRKVKQMLAGTLAAALGFVSAFGFGGMAALADPVDKGTIILDLSKDMEEKDPEKAPMAGAMFYDEEGDAIFNTLKAMEKVGQIKNVPIEGSEDFDKNFKFYDLDLDGVPDIEILFLDMGETLGRGVIIEVLGTRGPQLYNNWELEPNAQAVAVTESPYSSFLDIIFPPKHTHRFSTKWTAGKEGHYHACLNSTCPLTNEKDMDGYTAHTYGDWKVIAYATDSKEGSRKKTCTVCGYEYTQTIPKGAYDGSKLEDPTNPGGKGGTGTGQGASAVTKQSFGILNLYA